MLGASMTQNRNQADTSAARDTRAVDGGSARRIAVERRRRRREGTEPKARKARAHFGDSRAPTHLRLVLGKPPSTYQIFLAQDNRERVRAIVGEEYKQTTADMVLLSARAQQHPAPPPPPPAAAPAALAPLAELRRLARKIAYAMQIALMKARSTPGATATMTARTERATKVSRSIAEGWAPSGGRQGTDRAWR